MLEKLRLVSGLFTFVLTVLASVAAAAMSAAEAIRQRLLVYLAYKF